MKADKGLAPTNTARAAQFELQIDPTQFGLVAGYLANPRSPIAYLLHVPERAQLPTLAARIEEALASGPQQAERMAHTIIPMLREGSLKISSREQLGPPFQAALVDAAGVRKTAACDVIYLPPFYLVHTPGLFAANTQRPDPGLAALKRQLLQPAVTPDIPPQKQTKGHGMSH